MDISIRQTNIDDTSLYFEWANDYLVRKNSLNTEMIQWEDHVDWFKKKLNNEDTFMFVMEMNSQPVGQIRFEKKANLYEIFYSIDSTQRGKSLGKRIVSLGMQEMQKIIGKTIKFKAIVKISNTPSKRIFQDLNFQERIVEKDLISYFK
jgi:RimJ/RimL family protein N-acetyltransferase